MTIQLKGKKRATREANLKLAESLDDGGWTKATPFHWRRALKCGHIVDFWPTTMKAQFSWYSVETGNYDIELVENAYHNVEAFIATEKDG